MKSPHRMHTRLLVLYHLVVMTKTEIYSSIVDLEALPNTLKRTIDDLENYISSQEHKLYILNRYVDRYKNEHNEAIKDIPNYVQNPIKAYTLIKQLTVDLDSLKIIMKMGTQNITKKHKNLKYPLQKDLIGAASALGRLQKTYNLTVEDLSNGNLNKAAYRSPLTADDCYEIVKALFEGKHFVLALLWMNETLRKYHNKENIYVFTEIDIITYISQAYHYIAGDKKSALNWTKRLIDMYPKNDQAVKKVTAFYQNLLAEEKTQNKANGFKEEGDKSNNVADDEKLANVYEALCRGELVVPIKTSSRFSCRYLTENHAFLRIAPIKMEVMYLNPDVTLLHEVISEREIKFIKQIARPKLKRAKVHDPETGSTQVVEQRISKYAWLHDKESDVIKRISHRVSQITNLNITTAEPLQVVNYGIGGYFEPHCDFPPIGSDIHKDIRYINTGGDRVATVMFYLSDVAQGGATVFPELNVSVYPVKGAAIYWSNLNAVGELESKTLHAGCPVLLGSKWVANKWIHRMGQKLVSKTKP